MRLEQRRFAFLVAAAYLVALPLCAADNVRGDCTTAPSRGDLRELAAMTEREEADSQEKLIVVVTNHLFVDREQRWPISGDALHGVWKTVNELYRPANMEFVMAETQVHKNESGYDRHEHTNYTDEDFSLHYNAPNTFNIYWSRMLNDEGLCGYGYFPTGADWRKGTAWMRTSLSTCLVDSLPHELGHIFGLLHTHGLRNNYTDELVDESNCATAGDKVCDTPADPNIFGLVSDDCRYAGKQRDANGAPYEPDTSLLMSYSKKVCRHAFSPEQLVRIRRGQYSLHDKFLRMDVSLRAVNVGSFCGGVRLVGGSSHEAHEWKWAVANEQGIVVLEESEVRYKPAGGHPPHGGAPLSTGDDGPKRSVDANVSSYNVPHTSVIDVQSLAAGEYVVRATACYPFVDTRGRKVCATREARVLVAPPIKTYLRLDGIPTCEYPDAGKVTFAMSSGEGASSIAENAGDIESLVVRPQHLRWSDGSTDVTSVGSLAQGQVISVDAIFPDSEACGVVRVYARIPEARGCSGDAEEGNDDDDDDESWPEELFSAASRARSSVLAGALGRFL